MENSISSLKLTHNLNGQTLVLKPGASKRKIYDVFLFHNELDMLELRLIELEHVVDCFVIIEQPHTLTGTPKPLYFKEHNTTRFARFMNKIITLTSKRRQATPRRMGKGAPFQKHGPRGSEGCGSRRHDHLFRRGRDRFVAAPARSQNGGRLPYQRVCAFRYAVILLQSSLECFEWCLQQRQDFPSLVSRRLPWRQLIFRFQQSTLEFT